MKCFMCKGTLENKYTAFMLEMGDCIIIIKNVPSQVCTQCGEVSYCNEIAKKLESMVNRIKPIVSDVAVFEYSKLVA